MSDKGHEQSEPSLEEACRAALAEARDELAQLRPSYEAMVKRLRELRIGIRGLAYQYDPTADDDFTWCEHGIKDAVMLKRITLAVAEKSNDSRETVGESATSKGAVRK